VKTVTKISGGYFEKRLGGWGVGFMADYCMIMQTDYNVSCPDTTDYVTAGNSRLARGCQNSIGTHHYHLQSRHDEPVLLDTRQRTSLYVICNIH
jgi:hypothetical protein